MSLGLPGSSTCGALGWCHQCSPARGLEKRVGIPDGAYKPLTGDDKKVCTSLKKTNQTFVVKGQADLFTANAMTQALPSAAGFEAIEENDLAAVRRKQRAYQAWRNDPAIRQELQRADAYTAAFFLPKQEGKEHLVPVSQNLDAIQRGAELSGSMAEAVARAADEFRYLHWHLAFPDVMRAGGFDCLLGNPPWERIKLQEKEFFAARSEAIATAQNKAARERLIQALRAPEASEVDQRLVQEFELAKREAEGSGEFIRGSGRFGLTAVGDLNTYALFSELFLNLIGPEGRAGLIVPTGIATDNSTKAYFDAISSGNRLISLYDFRTGPGLFSEIGHQRFKFCLITLGQAEKTDFVFFALKADELADHRRHFTLESDDFTLLNPNTRTCPVFRSQMDAELTKRVCRRVRLALDMPNNSWKFNSRQGLFHLTNDSASGEIIEVCEFTGSEECLEPVIEGKHFHQFTISEALADAYLASRSQAHSNLEVAITQDSYRYLCKRKTREERLPQVEWPHEWLIVWRDICRSTDERTLISTVVPKSGISYTARLISSINESPTIVACLLGCFNSLPCDYLMRQYLSGTHLSEYIVKQVPLLPPGTFSVSAQEFILDRVIGLTYSHLCLKPWAEDLGYDGPPLIFDPVRRALLRAELDAYYAHLYGLSREELRYILDPADVMGPDYPSETFRVLKNNEIRQFGEFRTQRLVLEAWDRLFGGG